ncbi:cell division protein ZipA [Halomonas sp. TRM85114]|uniref:cell division protein ZipA n=1 Tax=Halomonas jincaotanensis TaxID=2810616 RepID=UPI001BD62AFD|nr:cell division protein ZipA [Halomonas jincaotanensis]MBS9403205.1 cell division protein ZipA [Halomonas jincaotanensis]
MELREWLIILGLALVTLIVIDGVRRLQRQRRIPRLDEVPDDAKDASLDPEEAARAAEINWELPNGGARVVRPAETGGVKGKPKLQRQEHPGGGSSVLAGFGESRADAGSRHSMSRQSPPPSTSGEAPRREVSQPQNAGMAPKPAETLSRASASSSASEPARQSVRDDAIDTPHQDGVESTRHDDTRREPILSALDDDQDAFATNAADNRLAAEPDDHDDSQDAERYRLVDLDGVSDSFRSGSRRVGASMQRSFTSFQKGLADRRESKRLNKARREEERSQTAARDAELHRQAQEQATEDTSLREAERRRHEADRVAQVDDAGVASDAGADGEVVRAHPVLEKALRHDVSAEQARHALSHAEEIIVITVMSRDEQGFSGTALLDLMLTCGLRYSRDMGIFHRFETEEPESQLQFSMVNVLKPGTFPIESMGDFRTTGVTLLMPLPGASDTAGAFEAMVETAMVIVRHLGGELKDENHSVMTAQTVGFARQRVQEFERRNRLNRYQAN